jgi:hypothetical protein
MLLLAIAGDTIGRWLRRAILALAQRTAHSQPNVPSEYYRFPPF